MNVWNYLSDTTSIIRHENFARHVLIHAFKSFDFKLTASCEKIPCAAHNRKSVCHLLV